MRALVILCLFIFCTHTSDAQSLFFKESSKQLSDKQKKIASNSKPTEDELITFFEINQTFLDRNEMNWIDSSRYFLETEDPISLKKLAYQLHKGIIYKNEGRTKNAKVNLEQLAESLEKFGAKKLSILAYIVNADFHRSLGLIDYAVDEINKIDTVYIKKQCYFLRAKFIHRIAAITFESQKNKDKALNYSLQGLELARQKNDYCTMGTNAMEIGYWVKHDKIRNEESEKYLIEAISYFEKSKARSQMLNAKLNLAILYLHNQFNYEKGYPLARSVVEDYNKNPVANFQIHRVYELLTTEAEHNNDYMLALKYSKEFQRRYFEYMSQTNSAQITEVQEAFQNHKLNLQKDILEKDYVNSQSLLNSSQSRNFWLAGTLLFFLLLLISMVFIVLRIRKINGILAKQDQLNKRAIAIVSHDFKGTIYSLYPIAKELASNPDNAQISARLNERIGVMREVSESLLGWLKSSLMKKGKHAAIEINSNINCILGELNTRIKEKHIEIILESEDLDYTIQLDMDTFNIALRNIVSNALKYSWDGSTIIITYKQDFISVQDFGIGMDTKKAKHLFDAETNQSVLGTEGEKGYGMGLILTYDLLKEAGFTLNVGSKKEEGTIFTILN
jgi:signal transduction histidine kinase